MPEAETSIKHCPKIPDLPLLTKANHVVTSKKTYEYNCIGWAAGEDDRWWWPIGEPPVFYWPPGVSKALTAQSFIDAFGTLGYKICANAELEDGFEKVALYLTKEGVPTHMARQLDDGRWASKLGPQWDIEHKTPAAVAGKAYGSAQVFLARLKV